MINGVMGKIRLAFMIENNESQNIMEKQKDHKNKVITNSH